MIGNTRRLTAPVWLGLVFVSVSLASCGAPEPPEAETRSGTPSDAVPEQPIEAVVSHDQRLEQHMDLMAAVPEDSLLQVLPTHLEEVGAILDEMEPMSLGIQSNTVWRSTFDSLQNDLARMRDMGADELGDFMADHSRRIERLIFLHDSVMGAES